MNLPEIVPWSFCWLGFAVFVPFAIFSVAENMAPRLTAKDSRNISFWLACGGFVVMILPIAVNVVALGWQVFNNLLTHAYASITPRTY